jgi:hypothetical protein
MPEDAPVIRAVLQVDGDVIKVKLQIMFADGGFKTRHLGAMSMGWVDSIKVIEMP